MTRPLIVTAELAPHDHKWLNALRKRHFPPERNQLDAHVTMFHAIPPSAQSEVEGLLRDAARQRAPDAMISGLMDLGGGVAFRIRSPDLDRIRGDIADRLHGLLTAQDMAGWNAHVTIQNKAERQAAVALRKSLEDGFEPRPLAFSGLGLHRYMGGPWEKVRIWSFRGF